MVSVVRLFLHRDKGKPEARPWGTTDEGEWEPSAPTTGLRGWIARKWEAFRTRWHEARGGLTGAMHRLWDWLHRRTPHDEPLLAQFRKARRIEVYHAESLSAEEARVLWAGYLAHRRRRHLPRFAFNLALAPMTVLLAPLPGPNLIGYWFAYRSVHHWLILYGLKRARAQHVPVSFHPVGDADSPSEGDPSVERTNGPTGPARSSEAANTP